MRKFILLLFIVIMAFPCMSVGVNRTEALLIDVKGGVRKMICSTGSVYGETKLTVYYDSIGKPMLLVEYSDYTLGAKQRVDTMIVTQDFKGVYKASVTMKDGRVTDYKSGKWKGVYKVDFNRWPWNLSDFVYDDRGNWTLVESGAYDITREMFYTLSPEDEALVAAYSAKREQMTYSVIPAPVRKYWPFAGLIVFGAGVCIAMVLLNRIDRESSESMRKKSAVAVTLGCAGVYMLAWYEIPDWGVWWPVGCSAVLLAGVACYFHKVRNIMIRRKYESNADIGSIASISTLILAFTGILLGLLVWSSAWMSIPLAIVFALSTITILVSNTKRCPTCHAIDSFYVVGRVNTGIHTDVRSQESVHTGPWKDKEVYSANGDYHSRSQANRRHTITETTTRYQKYKIKYRCSNCGYEFMSVEMRDRIGSETNKSYYDEKVERRIDIH